MKRNYRLSRQKGSALIMGIIIAMLAFLLVVSTLLASEASTRMSAKRTNGEAAFRIAEAGLHHAAMCLMANQSYTGESNKSLGAGAFTVTVSKVAGKPYQRSVSSQATVSYAEGLKVTRTLGCMVDMGTPPSISYYSVVTKGPLTLRGSTTIGSFPDPGQGDIGSNTSISVTGSVNVDGGAASAGGISITGSASVGGKVSSNTTPITFPSVNFTALHDQAAAKKVTNGSVTVSSSGVTTISGLINGNLFLSGTGHVIVDGPVYVTGTVNISNSAAVDGGTIVSVGDLNLSGQTTVTGKGSLALVTQRNVTMSSGTSVSAAVIAPNGTATLHGHSSIFGSLAANALVMSGNPSIIRNTQYTWPPDIVPLKLGFYHE